VGLRRGASGRGGVGRCGGWVLKTLTAVLLVEMTTVL